MAYTFNGTLGKWEVLPDYSKVVCNDDRYNNPITICHFSTKGKLKHRERNNPHLIAVAPELLNVLIEAVEYLDNVDAISVNNISTTSMLHYKMREVIKKALAFTD